MIGIYGIYRKSDDSCVYVGQSKHIKLRVCQHFTPKGKYNNTEYYYKILENCEGLERQELLNRETYWIDTLSPCDNKQKSGVMFYSEETLQNFSESHKGKHHSEETKRKIGLKSKGRRHKCTEETKRKIGLKSKGRHFKLSEEAKRKISESHKGEKNPMYGKHHSEETKQKMRKPKRKRINNV